MHCYARTSAVRIASTSLILLLMGAPQAQAQARRASDGASLTSMRQRLDALKQQLAEQRQQLQTLRRQLDEQQQGLQQLRGAAPNAAPAVVAAPLPAPGTAPVVPAMASAARPALLVPATAAATGAAQAAPATAVVAVTAPSSAAAASPAAAAPVGDAPARDSRPPEVAPLFEQPGVLTPKGKLVLEPSLQFGYSSSNRVVLVGYTIIPALLIGLVDVREVKRNTLTGGLSGRYGLSRRMEVELKVPYVYRSDSTVSREIFTGSSTDHVFDTSGKGIGDVEAALRYQLNDGGVDRPYYVAGLRVKSRTGTDPFSVVTDCTQRCVGPNVTGTGLPLTLPTGSGFYAVQPSLTWLFPSDPAVLFGSVSYLHNFRRNNVMRTVLAGEMEPLGTVAPGGVLGFNLGIGLALNDRAGMSIGYDHNSIARTRQNGQPVPGSVRTQLGTLMMGFSYRVSDKRTINIAVGAGLTRDTPDMQLSLRMPLSF